MQSKKDFACWRAIDKLYSGSLYHLHLDPSRNPVTTTCGHRGCYCSWSEKAACVALHQRPCARAWKQWCQPPSVLPLKDSVHMLLHHTEKRNSGVKQQISSQHKIKVSVLRELGDGTGHQWPQRMKDAALDKLANKEHRNTLLELFLILTFQSVYRHISIKNIWIWSWLEVHCRKFLVRNGQITSFFIFLFQNMQKPDWPSGYGVTQGQMWTTSGLLRKPCSDVGCTLWQKATLNMGANWSVTQEK